MTKLDEIAINVELVLISIVEGVALTNLAAYAIPLMHQSDVLIYIPYILSGLAIILAFWSQSILHTVSFIRWPIRVGHMFLYFIAAFAQIIAYSMLDNLSMWFFWWSIFTLIAFVMYIVDLRIIRESKEKFFNSPSYLHDVEMRHLYEMKYLVPIALIFNGAAFLITFFAPSLFLNDFAYMVPGILQLLISIAAIYDCVRNFHTRSAMIHGYFEQL